MNKRKDDDVISDVTLETMDLDWFAVDRDGFIGHFTTGGTGGIPPSVRSSSKSLSELCTYFQTIAPVIGQSVLADAGEQDYDVHPAFESLDAWKHMAERGLYSHDALSKRPRPNSYFLLASPEVPLRESDLPVEIRKILQRTASTTIAFQDSTLIAADAFT